MSHRSHPSLLRLLTTVLVLVASVGPVQGRGEWYDYYQDALQAIDNGDPTRAIELLDAALQRKPRSGYLRTYGNNYIRYVPHFYRGVAQHDVGNCPGALANFRLSAEANETAEVPGLDARLRSLRTACETRLAPPPVAEVEPSPEAPAPAPAATVEPPPIRPLARADAALLQRGIDSYLKGDFEGAIVLLDELLEDAPESPRLRLWLGMALHGSWTIGGQRDADLLDRSRRELAKAARLDPALVLDPALCPPRVVALYRSVR